MPRVFFAFVVGLPWLACVPAGEVQGTMAADAASVDATGASRPDATASNLHDASLTPDGSFAPSDAGLTPDASAASDGSGDAATGSQDATASPDAATGSHDATANADATLGAPDAVPDSNIIAADRRTTWNPGIPGGIPTRTTVCATLAAATYGDGAQNAAAAIQQAIDSCPEGQVVVLGAGTFLLADTLSLTKGVVLRGAGSQNGGRPATTLNRSPAGVVIAMGRVSSTSNADLGSGVALAQDAPKGATTINLAGPIAGLGSGAIVQIDQRDDPALVLNSAPYDCPYFKRAPDRSIGQRIEIASVSGNVLTLASPLHWSFTTALGAEVAPVGQPITKYAGVEGVHLIGGNHPYDGGGINVWNAAYSWVRDVETDTITGQHIVLSGAYRFVIRDSYVHHSGDYGYGVGSYGITLRFQTADSLVENNIVRYMNKPILFNASGGGNVLGYNYVDDSWATPGWQEVNIDCHCNFPHMELIEGNYAPHMGMSSTHGNAGFLTFFRNYSSTQFHEITEQTGNVAAIQLDTMAQSMNVVGNVLGAPGLNGAYEEVSDDGQCGQAHMFLLGSGFGTSGCSWSANPAADPAISTLFRHGNFDYVTNTTVWSASSSQHTIPASLYLSGKPAFWPASSDWPWVGPDLNPKVAELPAKLRFDQLP